jgi:hypothetical protein
MRALATAIVLLALMPAAAGAKTGISLNPPPDGLAVGEPWDVSFQYIRNDVQVDPAGPVKPSVSITSEDSGRTQSFAAQRTHKGLWTARVVFPRPGVWDYSIQGLGKVASAQSWNPVTIKAARGKLAPVAASSGGGGGGSFPYGWVGGGAAVALLAGGLLVMRLRS